MSAGSPFCMTAQTFAAAGLRRSTAGSDGSSFTDQAGWKTPRASRFWIATVTAAGGSGNLTDSWKPRGRSLASGVVSHSPYTLAKPRE